MTSRLMALLPGLALALVLGPTVRADLPKESAPPRPTAGQKSAGGLKVQVLRAYRSQQLFSGEDYYGAASVLAAGSSAADLELAADLGLAAIEKGFPAGHRIALAAHRRFASRNGIERGKPISIRRPKSFTLSPKPRPLAKAV